MTIRHLAVSGYRSLQHVVLPLDRLTLVTGANGRGKSNLYRALSLIVAAARGEMVGALAREGGLPAVLWAGPERLSREMRQGERAVQGGPRQAPVRLRLGFAADPFSYAIEDAFPGCHLSVGMGEGLFRLRFHQPSLLRPLDAAELSDGTLRYILLTAALFSPRLPPCWCSTNRRAASTPICWRRWRG